MEKLTDKPKHNLDYLPEAMVEEMLGRQTEIVNQISSSICNIAKLKEEIRKYLQKLGLLTNVTNFLLPKTYPTAAGVDGSFGIVRQLTQDLVAIAAVAVEGLVPPRETRKWDKPHHIVDIFPVQHHSWTSRMCRAIMFSRELKLANEAVHQVVFLDGSLTTPLIQLGQGLSAIQYAPQRGGGAIPRELCERLEGEIQECLQNYHKVLTSPKSDQIFVGIPKYSSRAEVITKLRENGLTDSVLERSNDKGLLTAVLEPGEVILPIQISPTVEEKEKWHLSGTERYPHLSEIVNAVKQAVGDLYVMYFKPSKSHPALRLEISPTVANDSNRLSILLASLLHQAKIPGILEPYPLYVADLFVRHAYGALMEIVEASASDVDRMVREDFSVTYLSLHSYRTEGGYE